jgi:hypothetical protein
MEYPDMQSYSYGRVIEACWKGDFNSAQEVVDAFSEDLVEGRHGTTGTE